MRQLFLLAAVICFGMAILKFYSARMDRPSAKPQASDKPWATITAEEAKTRLDENPDAILLDVRTQEEYDGGHVPGAVCFPNEDILPELPLPFEKDAEILVYCRSGRRSAEAAEKLTGMGYANVSDFGGIQDWPYETTTD
nr:rhodanese-like domain-containing protein [uncultured Oscillibacter sp.]